MSEPGEIVIIDDTGYPDRARIRKDTQLAICSMEYIYFARPIPILQGSMSIEPVRIWDGA